jgi:hypothetical protein
MMDEQFDNELKDRIKSAFENFEHHAVDKGWQRFQHKFPETGKNRGANWLWAGIALVAALLIFLGINVVITHQESETKKISQKAINHYNNADKISSQSEVDSGMDKSSSHTATTKHLITDTVLPNAGVKIIAKIQASKTQMQAPKSNHASVIKTSSIKNRTTKTQTIKTDNETVLSSTDKKEEVAVVSTANTAENLAPVTNTDTSKEIAQQGLANSFVAHDDTAAKAKSSVTLQNTKAKSRKTIEKDTRKVEFGIYAGPYVSYAQGSSATVNAGAGVTVDIPLFKNLKLSTGLAIEQHTLNYGSQLPNNTSVFLTNAALKFNLVQQLASAATAGVPYSLVLDNYTARLVGLDLPLNLKYQFNSQTTYRYLSVGVSSGAFIHQSYTYQYNYSSRLVKMEALINGLNNYHVANTLNVAFGFGYPVGKNNRLIIEPFIKYPLSGLGDESLRFGAGGINLKFGFQSAKK